MDKTNGLVEKDEQLLKQQKTKKCFIISPFGSDNSDIRRKAEGLIDAVIKPVLEEMNFFAYSSLDISKAGSITHQVIQALLEDDLVISNLTGLNPNVMYELAVRHAKRKPVVSLVEKGTILPFDISQERTIFYDNDMRGAYDLKPSLRNAIEEVMRDEIIDNPIYRVIQQSIIQEHVKTGSFEDLILNRLTDIENKVTATLNSNHLPATSGSTNHYPIVLKFSTPGADSSYKVNIWKLINSVGKSGCLVQSFVGNSVTIGFTNNGSARDFQTAYLEKYPQSVIQSVEEIF